jgi:hypothetical protein
VPWPPRIGELLPRYDEPVGIEEKLREYSLLLDHKRGGPKANGFWVILGIGPESLDYLAHQIRDGVVHTPISSIRVRPSGAAACTVQFHIAGPGSYSHRTASLRTVWVLDTPSSPPRLITAFLRGRKHR